MQFKKPELVPYSAMHLDINFNYILQALTQFVTLADRYLLEQLLQKTILNKKPIKGIDETVLLTSSLHTAFDCILQALNFPLGSEVVLTAVNTPDIVQIIRNHGLIPIPVEISEESLSPAIEDFKNAFTDKTKLVLVNFIFGAKFQPQELYEYAHSQGCLVVEDQAESFTDVNDQGNPSADFTMFSFDTFMPFTAFGGGITVMRNQEAVYRKSKEYIRNYPVMSNYSFLKKILKNIPAAIYLNQPSVNKLFRQLMLKIGIEFKIKTAVKGLKTKKSLLEDIRVQIPTPMMALLFFRLRDYNAVLFQIQKGKLLSAQNNLIKGGVQVPGSANKNRTFYLYPIITSNPKVAYEILNARGIDAYLGATELDLVESPIGTSYKYPLQTKEFFQKIIYLPIHRDVPEHIVNKIVKESVEVCKLVSDIDKDKRNQARPSL